ncbi:MAG: hypothetical protein ACO258_11940 [Burkholderiaceae bacterium]
MITEANQKNILLINGAAITNGATSTGSFDCRGFDFAQITVYKSLATALTSLKVEQSDDDSTYSTINLTSGTDFTAATNGTAAATTIPYYVFNIDTRGTKRYLKVSLTPGATTDLVCHVNLGRRAIGSPVNNTGNGTTVDARTILSV